MMTMMFGFLSYATALAVGVAVKPRARPKDVPNVKSKRDQFILASYATIPTAPAFLRALGSTNAALS
jgi:hypothetical protein